MSQRSRDCAQLATALMSKIHSVPAATIDPLKHPKKAHTVVSERLSFECKKNENTEYVAQSAKYNVESGQRTTHSAQITANSVLQAHISYRSARRTNITFSMCRLHCGV